MKVKYKYIGDGAFVVGLPARDISEEEATPEMDALVEDNMKTPTPCYEKAKQPAAKPAKESA